MTGEREKEKEGEEEEEEEMKAFAGRDSGLCPNSNGHVARPTVALTPPTATRVRAREEEERRRRIEKKTETFVCVFV